jgi:DNA-binding transcriptional LysR family regulator
MDVVRQQCGGASRCGCAGMRHRDVPVFIAEKELKNGTLRSILTDYRPPALSLYALYPPTRHLAVKVRLFIDFLIRHL